MLIISFDFDATLSRPDVQAYAKTVLSRGVEVWIVTSRYDKAHKHRYAPNPSNAELWAVVNELGIDPTRVRFTCMEAKSRYLFRSRMVWHLDDDEIELEQLAAIGCGTVGIHVETSDWLERCEAILSEAQ